MAKIVFLNYDSCDIEYPTNIISAPRETLYNFKNVVHDPFKWARLSHCTIEMFRDVFMAQNAKKMDICTEQSSARVQDSVWWIGTPNSRSADSRWSQTSQIDQHKWVCGTAPTKPLTQQDLMLRLNNFLEYKHIICGYLNNTATELFYCYWKR